MFKAISTTESSNIHAPSTESSNIHIHAPSNGKPFCVMTLALVLVGTTIGTASIPVQPFAESQNTFFSTETSNRNSYNSGNISLWLEGDSVMSVDKAQSLERLIEIEQLQENWNGNGAKRFSDSILSFARKIVMNLLIQPAIFPTARDSIQLEYENDLGDYLELELFEDEQIKMFSFDHTGKSLTQEINFDSINKVVSKFYG